MGTELRPIPLPPEYQPLPKWRLCSNMMENVRVPLRIGDNIAFLVGQGSPFSIWIWSPHRDAKQWTPLVRKNEPLLEGIRVETGPGFAKVTFEDAPILVAQMADIPEVSFIDLSPIGVPVSGKSSRLRVMGTTFASNRFTNTGTAIVVDASTNP